MKNLFFSERCELVQSPFEWLWAGIVLLACDLFKNISETDEYVSEDGVVPRRYWRGVLLNGSVVNLSAFTDEAIHGAGGANDYIVVGCLIERKVLRQKLFHPTLEALDRSRDPALTEGQRQHWIILALRAFRAIFERYPSILGEDRRLQEKFGEFINPKFGQPGEGFMSTEQQRVALNDPSWVDRFRPQVESNEFDQVYNPVRFEGVTREEFVEALRRREIYEFRMEGQVANFVERREKSVFSVVQRKFFDLRFVHRETGAAIKMEHLSHELQHQVEVVVQPSPIMLATQFVSPREIDELLDVYAPAATPPVAFAPGAPAPSAPSDKSADFCG